MLGLPTFDDATLTIVITVLGTVAGYLWVRFS